MRPVVVTCTLQVQGNVHVALSCLRTCAHGCCMGQVGRPGGEGVDSAGVLLEQEVVQGVPASSNTHHQPVTQQLRGMTSLIN